MEEQEVRAYGQNPRLRWAGLVIGCLGSFATLQTLWKHGMRNWDWVEQAWFAALGLSIALDAWQSPQRTWNWPSRLFCVGYGVLFGALIGHAYGWIPGTCIIALFAFFTIDRKSGWSSADLKSPVRILQLALVLILVAWFIARVEGWHAYALVVAIMVLLGSEKKGRRSLKANLLRPAFVAWIATWALSFYWHGHSQCSRAFWQPSYSGSETF